MSSRFSKIQDKFFKTVQRLDKLNLEINPHGVSFAKGNVADFINGVFMSRLKLLASFVIILIGLNSKLIFAKQVDQGLPAEVTYIKNYLNQDVVEVATEVEVINDGATENLRSLDGERLTSLRTFYTEANFASGLFEEIHSLVMLAELEDGISMTDLKLIFPDKCDIVMDQIAQTVRNEVSTVLLEGATDIRRACPQWDSLSADDRKNFYVALVTSMALAESSCNNKIKGAAVNGTAHGLWQSRKKLSPKKGARWVMTQIESQVNQSGLLFWPNSKLNYWAVLNPDIHAFKVKRLLKKIPACVVDAIAFNEK